MTVFGASCTGNNCGVNFTGGKGVMPQTSPIDSAGDNFDDAMTALANAAKALINAKKAEGAKNEALTKEKVEAKFLDMKNSKPVNYDDLYDMGCGISGGDDNRLVSCESKTLNPAIFKGKDTVVIGKKEAKENYVCEKYTEYDRKGRPVASIQKLTSESYPNDPRYNAAFFKYDKDYSTYSQMTLYKSSACPNELLSSHPMAFLQVGNYI